MHCDRYQIIESKRFAVHPYCASICWVYLDATGDWFCKLDQKNNKRLREIANAPRFPHYRTFFQRGAQVVRLRAPDVNALSNLTAWTVLTEQEKIAEILGITSQETRPCPPDEP